MTDTGLALRHISRLHERWNSCIAGRNCVFGLVPSPERGIFSDWPSAWHPSKVIQHPTIARQNRGRQILEKAAYSRLNDANDPAWYCARTKPKHEHIAAANVRKHLGLEVFHPQLRVERSTRRGLVRTIEPLFPCYIFVRCAIQDRMNEVRYTNGISTIVHFADKIPPKFQTR